MDQSSVSGCLQGGEKVNVRDSRSAENAVDILARVTGLGVIL